MGLRLGIAFLRSREKKIQILLMYLYYVSIIFLWERTMASDLNKQT